MELKPINPHSNHYRLYCWSRRLLDTFWNRHELLRFEPSNRVNLCPYIRTFLAMAGVVALHVALGLWLAYAFIWLPSTWVKYFSVNWAVTFKVIGIILIVVLAITAAVAIISGFIWLIMTCTKEKEEKHSGFCHLVAIYCSSAHDFLCPEIRVGED
jgi:hypothetical protein